MQKVIITRGLPASGKSTWAKATVKADPENWKRINKDDLRLMIHAGEWNSKIEKDIIESRDALLRHHLTYGKSVIIDDTNIEPHHINAIFKIVELEYPNVEFEVLDFDTPYDECIIRDKNREANVGKSVITKMRDRYNRIDKDHWKTLVSNRMVPDFDTNNSMTLESCIIVDIDGTVAIKGDRSPFDWSRVSLDSKNAEIIHAIIAHRRTIGSKIVFLSGRDSVCKKDTVEWLDKHITEPYELYMRPEGDNRPDYRIKRELYDNHIRGKYRVHMVFDDRDSVVHLWRRHIGLVCAQVNYGNF